MSVCHGCTKRKLHCHSACERYLAERDAAAQVKTEILKKKHESKVVGDVLLADVADGKQKIRRRIARHKKY